MLKPTFFILFSIVLGYADTSHALDAGGTLSDILPGSKCNKNVGVFTNVPEVKLFIDTFLEYVYKSDALRDLFDFSKSTSQEYAEFVKKDVEKVLLKIGVDGQTATTLSEFAAEAIPQIDSLTLPVVSRSIANMAVNFLFVDEDLKPGVAEDRAKALVKSMEDSAKATVTADPKSKFVAVNNGLVFVEDKEFSPTRAPIFYFYVGNEWFIAANNPCQ